jgi:hypothetical protein
MGVGGHDDRGRVPGRAPGVGERVAVGIDGRGRDDELASRGNREGGGGQNDLGRAIRGTRRYQGKVTATGGRLVKRLGVGLRFHVAAGNGHERRNGRVPGNQEIPRSLDRIVPSPESNLSLWHREIVDPIHGSGQSTICSQQGEVFRQRSDPGSGDGDLFRPGHEPPLGNGMLDAGNDMIRRGSSRNVVEGKGSGQGGKCGNRVVLFEIHQNPRQGKATPGSLRPDRSIQSVVGHATGDTADRPRGDSRLLLFRTSAHAADVKNHRHDSEHHTQPRRHR